jgi:hypothetical protein
MTLDLETFERGLRTLVDLRENHALRILVGSPGVTTTQLDLPDDHPAFSSILDMHSISIDDLDRVGSAVASTLDEVLAGSSIEDFVEQSSDDEDQGVLRRKYELIARSFDIDLLRRRMWLKQTAKTNIPAAIHWEIGLKYSTDSEYAAEESPLPMAVLQIATRPSRELGFLQERVMSMTLDCEDIDYLIATLTRLRVAFSALESDVRKLEQ